MRRQVLNILVLSVVIAIGTFLLARKTSSRAQAPAASSFTATFLEESYDSAGALRNSEYYIEAVRSDGSDVRVHRRKSPNDQWVESRVIMDVSAKTRITVDALTDSLITYPFSDGEVQQIRNLSLSCTRNKTANWNKALGFDVERVAEDMPAPPGEVFHVEAWAAPALGCLPLREEYTTGNIGGPSYKTVRTALFVIRGEPSPSLFELPVNYVERTPSEVFKEYARRYPGSASTPQSSLDKMDEVYKSHKNLR